MEMKTLYASFLTGMFLCLVSCSEEELCPSGNTGDGMLKIRPQFSGMEVVSKAEVGRTFYAYTMEDLAAGILQPYARHFTQGEIIYYKIPKENHGVFFSNMDSRIAGNVSLSVSEEGSLVFGLTDPELAAIPSDILFGMLDNITVGNQEVYDVPVRRISSQLVTRFMVADPEGDAMTDGTLETVKVTYGGFSSSFAVNQDGTFSESGNAGLVAELRKDDAGIWTSEQVNVIPGNSVNPCSVLLSFSDGTEQTFETNLGRILESNRSYTVTLRLTKDNGSAVFTLEEPELYENSYSIYPSEQKIFDVNCAYTVGKNAGNYIGFEVRTLLPYSWSYELTDGQEYFTVSREDDHLTVTALSENVAGSRTGTIVLRTEKGHEQTVRISQLNGSKQVMYVTKHNSEITLFNVEGTNIEIDYGSGLISCGNGGTVRLSSSEFPTETTATITADSIISFEDLDDPDYKYSYRFENCISLTDLSVDMYNESFDFSVLPALKNLNADESALTDMTFAEGQGIESLSLQDCNFTSLDVSSMAGTLKRLSCGNNRNLASLVIYPADYSGERPMEYLKLHNTAMTGLNCSSYTNLRYLNVDNCKSMESVNLSGCSSMQELDISNNSLTFLNISNCTSLRNLTLQYVEINTIVRTGADAIETIKLGTVTIVNFDFSNLPSLKSIIIGDTLSSDYFNISNCPNVTIINANIGDGWVLTSADNGGLNIDISNCTSLDYIRVNELKTWKVDNTPNLKRLDILRSGAEVCSYDFSKHPGLEYLQLYNIDIDESQFNLDLSACTNMKTVVIDEVGLSSIALPKSVENLDFWDWTKSNLTELNLGGYTNLKSVDINVRSLYHLIPVSIILSDCTSLVSVDLYGRMASVDLSGCLSLAECSLDGTAEGLTSVDLSGCTAPMHLYVGSTLLSELDLSGTGVKECEITSNKNLTSVSFAGCGNLESCTVSENAILWTLDFSGCQSLKTIDAGNGSNPIIESVGLSGCSSLEEFTLSGARLTGLELSDCTSLEYLDVKDNLMQAYGLNAMFRTMYDRSSEPVTGSLFVSGNPGESDCDRTIVLNKNWYFPVE